MVAIIHNSKSLKNVLHYNENKVRQKAAFFIHACNYPKDAELLDFSDKINRLKKLVVLNQQTTINSVHISLNFDSSDKLNAEKFREISDVYMQRIGFGNQPYLVYQHNDAGHPHIHIVTTNIRNDGTRIILHNLGRNQSEKARKEIEYNYNLVKAERAHCLTHDLKPVNAQKVHYGKSETRRAITNVLDHVLPTYKYASLAELNAVLQQYNIIADRGSESSRIYQSKGLVYRILDGNKQKVGVPIKASLIYSQPTLKNIEANFERNEAERQRYKQRIMNAVDLLLLKRKNYSLPELMNALQKENIHVVLRQNDKGIIYGVTYVDHKTKCVFNGSYLGKQYSANALQLRCAAGHPDTSKEALLRQSFKNETTESMKFNTGLLKVFDDLLQPENNQSAGEPSEQKKFKRKRKKKQQQSHN